MEKEIPYNYNKSKVVCHINKEIQWHSEVPTNGKGLIYAVKRLVFWLQVLFHEWLHKGIIKSTLEVGENVLCF